MNKKARTPYFSVIIPTLNEEEFLPRLLKDLNAQTWKDFEVFVVDGHSEDRTVAITTSFPATYPLQCIPVTKRNVSFQRNTGASKARGKVLVFFDADTQIPKHYLEKLHHCFETKRPHFVTSYIKVDSNKPTEVWFAALVNLIFELSRIVKAPVALGAMQAIKRTVFEDIDGYDEVTKFGEDAQLFQKAQDYNYKYLTATNFSYTYSLRRLRAEGIVDTMYQYLKLNLLIALKGHHLNGIKYDMGGSLYKNLKKPQFTRRFDHLFKRLKTRTKNQSQAMKQFIDRLRPF